MLSKPWFKRNSNLIANLYENKDTRHSVDDDESEALLNRLEDVLTMYNKSDLLLHNEENAIGYDQLNRQFILDWADVTITNPEVVANNHTLSEIFMMVYATVYCTASHQNRRGIKIENLNRLRLMVITKSVRHLTKDVINKINQYATVELTVKQICQYITQHCRNGLVSLYQNLKPPVMDENKDAMVSDTVLKFDETNIRLFQSFQYQPISKDPQELAKISDDLNQGQLFKQNVTQVVMSSIALFTRYVLTVKLHDLLLNEHIQQTDPIYLDVEIEAFTIWFRSHSEIHSNSDFVRLLHEIIFSSLVPLGSRIDSLKNPDTRDINLASQRLCEREFGTDLVEQLRDEFISLEVADVLADPTHRYYSWIFICVFAFWFEQTLKVKWTKIFFISESIIIFRYKELLQRKDNQGVPMDHNYAKGLKIIHSPLCVYLDTKWWVYYDFKWYVCVSVESMLLTWCLLLQRHANSQTTDQIDLKPFFARIGLSNAPDI